jgi:hypothetical protein
MKKITLILFLMTLFHNIASFSQTVTIDGGLIVNNTSISPGATINLGTKSVSNINLVAKVVLPKTQNDSSPGTISVIFQKNTNSPANIASGGFGGNLLFLGGLTVTRSFNIILDATDFDLTGGFLYVEFKSYSGVKYKSGNISIIKSSTPPPVVGPNPASITNQICCNQTVRLGDKPAPIIGSQYGPYQNISSSWSMSNTIETELVDQTLNFGYTNELKNITVTRGIDYNTSFNFNPKNKSNTVTITVVPSPILTNEISVNAPVDLNGFIEVINTNPIQFFGTRPGSQVNLNIINDPLHISKRGDNFDDIEKFEWEYSKTNSVLGGANNWITIVGENSNDLNIFNPTKFDTNQDNYYLLRRIAIYKNIKRASNTLKIVLRSIRNNNTICCNQILKISSTNNIETPTIIIGSDAVSNKNLYFTYQWQSQSIDSNSSKISNWINIPGAKSKDYLPPPLQFVTTTSSRGGTSVTIPITYNYRRITQTQQYDGETSYSNEINLSAMNEAYYSAISVFPNPASTKINIQKHGTPFNIANLTITDISGNMVNLNNFSIIDPSLISIDISNLKTGPYFVKIESAGYGGRRNSSDQVTFIKN